MMMMMMMRKDKTWRNTLRDASHLGHNASLDLHQPKTFWMLAQKPISGHTNFIENNEKQYKKQYKLYLHFSNENMGVDVECGTPLTPPPPPPKSTGGFPAKKATDSIWKLGSSNNLPTVFFLLLCSRLLVVREREREYYGGIK